MFQDIELPKIQSSKTGYQIFVVVCYSDGRAYCKDQNMWQDVSYESTGNYPVQLTWIGNIQQDPDVDSLKQSDNYSF